MEVLFKNRYVSNKEVVKEIYRYYNFQRKRIIAFDILFALSFLVNIILLICGQAFNWSSIIIAPLFFFFQFYVFFRQVNIIAKRDKEICEKEIEVEMTATEEFIQTASSTGSVYKLEYSNIRSVVQTKNLILLFSKANLVYIFKKNGFTEGTKEEFIEFLRSKGIKVK